MKRLKYLLLFGVAVALLGCTDLEEELTSVAPEEDVNPADLLNGAYGGLRNLQSQDQLFALVVHPTDELAGPTRGRDWDDAGLWRSLHLHAWTTAHPFVESQWRTLNQNAFNAQGVLCAGVSGQAEAEATFLRVFNEFLIADLYGKVPRRQCGEDVSQSPSTLLTRENVLDVLIADLEAVMNNLPDGGNAALATKDAGRALLMKMYLSKAVYAATSPDGMPSAGPFTFEASDMNRVIALADEIEATNLYSLDDNYYDNFIPDNGNASSELIFVSENTSGAAAGNVRARWFMTTHYNQTPGGWNGFVALADLYDLYEENDQRRRTDLDFLTEESGYNAGFLIGQQFGPDGTALEDRLGNPLAFTKEFSLREGGDNLEVTGIRVIKYPTDNTTPGDQADNDYVFLRYADVVLMKAEALLRTNQAGDALTLVNELRRIRNASELTSLDEQTLLDERSRELYHEGWRRQDQIRFGTFTGTWQEKPNPSDPSRILFPIPAEAISTDPNLPQNPGY